MLDNLIDPEDIDEGLEEYTEEEIETLKRDGEIEQVLDQYGL